MRRMPVACPRATAVSKSSAGGDRGIKSLKPPCVRPSLSIPQTAAKFGIGGG